MAEYYILVTGYAGVGKTTFLKTFARFIPSDMLIHKTDPLENYNGLDRIRIQCDDDLVLGLFSHGSSYQFTFYLWNVWQDIHPIIGMIVLAGAPEDWEYYWQPHTIKSILAMNDAWIGFPVVLAYQATVWAAKDIRLILRLENDIPILPCDITNPDSVREIIIALLEQSSTIHHP